MRTVGVDLSAQPKETAVATIDWHDRGATLTGLVVGADDRRIVDLAAAADQTGIDSPFGWPSTFVDFVSRHRTGQPHETRLDSVDHRRPLLWRVTDFHVKSHTGLNPLSVAAEKIAIVAMRCAGLLQLLGVVDRVNGPVVEVYPASALACWSLPSRGYKGANALPARSLLLDQFRELAPLLDFGRFEQQCKLSDHALDAVVASVVARAAALGQTIHPHADQLERVQDEGWIHLPTAQLGQLLGNTS